MSRNQAARTALLLGQYEQALARIIEVSAGGLDLYWPHQLQEALQTIHTLADTALGGKRVFRLGEPPAQGKPSKK